VIWLGPPFYLAVDPSSPGGGSGGIGTAEVITGGVLALAAIISALTPVVLARRRARREELTDAAKLAARSGDLTLAGWQALNGALQEEIKRLQGVTEKMQSRIDQLETEIDQLRHVMRDHDGIGHA
jgi:peptidoglycan hydrolase CwlO-like protein